MEIINWDTLLKMFDEVTDVRDSTGKRHCLSHILVMSVCGILNKQIDFEDIHDYALAHKEYFDETAAHTRDFSHELAAKELAIKTYIC